MEKRSVLFIIANKIELLVQVGYIPRQGEIVKLTGEFPATAFKTIQDGNYFEASLNR